MFVLMQLRSTEFIIINQIVINGQIYENRHVKYKIHKTFIAHDGASVGKCLSVNKQQLKVNLNFKTKQLV